LFLGIKDTCFQLLVPANKRYEKYRNIREVTLIQNYSRTKKQREKRYGHNRM
jgi:predicted MarR family transcription regulator